MGSKLDVDVEEDTSQLRRSVRGFAVLGVAMVPVYAMYLWLDYGAGCARLGRERVEAKAQTDIL
jgi:hypothetical protein